MWYICLFRISSLSSESIVCFVHVSAAHCNAHISWTTSAIFQDCIVFHLLCNIPISIGKLLAARLAARAFNQAVRVSASQSEGSGFMPHSSSFTLWDILLWDIFHHQFCAPATCAVLVQTETKARPILLYHSYAHKSDLISFNPPGPFKPIYIVRAFDSTAQSGGMG